MTLGAVHAAAMMGSAAVLAVVLTLWIIAEVRRRDAERCAQSVRADAVRLLIEAHRLALLADRHLAAWHRETPQAWTLAPEQEHVRLAASSVSQTVRLTQAGAELFTRESAQPR